MSLQRNPFRPLGDAQVHLQKLRRMARAARCDLAAQQAGGTLPQDTWAAMVTRCRGCCWAEGCDRWLDRAGTTARALPRQCLNGAQLAAMGNRAPDPD